jgi:hypothetical protein
VQSQTPEPAGVALAVAIAADVGEVGAAARLNGAATLDRSRVEQEQIVVSAGALSRHDSTQPLDRVAQPLPPLVKSVLARQPRKQVPQLPLRGPQEPPIRRNPHQHLRDAQGDDLRVGQPPTTVPRPGRKQVVRRAIDANTEQVEVGAHRGPPMVDVALATPTSTRSRWSLAATKPVASII